MSSKFSAARPKRAGEAFARAHHGEQDGNDASASTKKVKFDIRNPSALAPSARDDDDDDDADDDVLAADVIGGSGRATKRGAVNIDGYDSDSDNETFNARAEARGKKGRDAEDVDLAEVMDNYNSKAGGANGGDDDDEVDMFGDLADDDDEAGSRKGKGLKSDKEVRFLSDKDIEGQEFSSKGGGTVHLDDDGESTDDDEAEIAAAIAEEGVDEEVGLGGLKKHAPKIDAFNMKQENEEGAFDESGNYIRKAIDADAVHDRWLEGLSKKEIKKAAAAQEKRDAEQRQKQREDDSILTGDLLKQLIVKLDMGETALEALARLGKGLTKPKKVPKWKQKKSKHGDAMDVDAEKEPEDPKQTKLKKQIDEITDAADKLLGRDYPNIYDTERERLVRIYRNETGEAWVEPPEEDEADNSAPKANQMWEFRWTDGRDDAEKQGPFDGPMMKAWQDAGYFGEGVEFRPAGDEGGWTRVASFV
ncbi:LIN1-like protein [Echria macrotheca]|uniref:LIN1-like protein n=1 Tax=Echria macrotheca TaxID=438768 RepID=A0AAJ0BSG3_9PEZI|nr:LIN1-like protein [Echria macrotheca]